jgi:hypothetical protein
MATRLSQKFLPVANALARNDFAEHPAVPRGLKRIANRLRTVSFANGHHHAAVERLSI